MAALTVAARMVRYDINVSLYIFVPSVLLDVAWDKWKGMIDELYLSGCLSPLVSQTLSSLFAVIV